MVRRSLQGSDRDASTATEKAMPLLLLGSTFRIREFFRWINKSFHKNWIPSSSHAYFGTGRWLVDRESSAALSRTLSSMKVQEDVPGETGTTRITALGAGVNFGLLEVFMGYLWEWDIPDVLKKNKLI